MCGSDCGEMWEAGEHRGSIATAVLWNTVANGSNAPCLPAGPKGEYEYRVGISVLDTNNSVDSATR